jgi:hypothetical protein
MIARRLERSAGTPAGSFPMSTNRGILAARNGLGIDTCRLPPLGDRSLGLDPVHEGSGSKALWEHSR